MNKDNICEGMESKWEKNSTFEESNQEKLTQADVKVRGKTSLHKQ